MCVVKLAQEAACGKERMKVTHCAMALILPAINCGHDEKRSAATGQRSRPHVANGEFMMVNSGIVSDSFRFRRRVRCATLKVVGRSTRMRPRCCDTEICNCRGVEARLAATAARNWVADGCAIVFRTTDGVRLPYTVTENAPI